MKSDLSALVGANEKILWQGRPNKKCFILESIFNPLLPIAIIWAIIDLSILGGASIIGSTGGMSVFFGIFMLLHLMPVWLYLGGVLLSIRRFKNTEYLITDRGIYVSGGTFSYTYEMKPFTDLAHINIHRGILDQWIGVGDVISQCHHDGYVTQHNAHNTNSQQHGINICNIADYKEVFALIKRLQTDIYADTMYPNDLRPKQNHGYNTEYTPDSEE